MKVAAVVLLSLFIFIKVDAQDQTDVDSLKSNILIDISPLEVISHPIQKHFQYGQNKLEINQSSRELAATFDDPSRVLYRHVGISTPNDQANAIVYRGLPSEFTKWSINGAEIVNPNHLSNAGRLSDQSSPSAGGVLAIPFEVVNKFSFYGNPYGPQQINALSGVADFNFDMEGDNFFKVGLLGMEAGFQKNLNEEGDQNIKGDFRYSTVGLLSDFGVDFDGESIKFYDGFIKVDLSNKLSVVAIAGNSTNFHTAVDDVALASQIKDLQDIDFSSKFFITGLTYKSDKYNQSLFVSQRLSERKATIDEDLIMFSELKYRRHFSRKSQTYSYNGNRKMSLWDGQLFVGAEAVMNKEELERDDSWFQIDYFNIRPYLNYKHLFSLGNVALKFEPGLAVDFLGTGDVRVSPSFFGQAGTGSFLLDFNYARKNRYEKDINRFQEKNRNQVETISAAIKYLGTDNDLSLMLRAFHSNILSSSYTNYLVLNDIETVDGYFFSYRYSPESDLVTKGVEFMIDKSWDNGWYVNGNITLFDAQYSLNDTILRSSQSYTLNTNDNYKNIYNVSVSKDFYNKKKNKWVVNVAYHQRGGAYQNRFIDEGYQFDEVRLSTYYRVDARIQYTWNNKNIMTLDIQNLTNKINDGYYYYDAFLEEEVLETQLGTIPILSYKRIL